MEQQSKEIRIKLSRRDSEDLAQLAVDCGTNVTAFATEVVENAIADRRMIRITRSKEPKAQ